MPLKHSQDVRNDIATRLTAGQKPKDIAEALDISSKTIYRYKKSFLRDGDTYVAPEIKSTPRECISREQLLALSDIMHNNPKITLKELLQKAIEDNIFDSAETAPDTSTVYRRLVKLGYKWQKPKYSDPRAKRSRIQFERCCFRQAQQNGMDAKLLLSMDESNFYYEQGTRAWGTTYKPPTLEKPKGKIMRRSMFATIGYTEIKSEPKAFIHWTLVIPRKSYKPLPDRIQAQELAPEDKTQLKQRYTADFVNTRTCVALKEELKSLRIRAPENRMASIKDVLLRVGRRGSIEGELRRRSKGRPDTGGRLIPPTGNAHMVSEYLHQCLGIYLDSGELWGSDRDTCELSADLGIRGCPSGGRREWNTKRTVRNMYILWDNAPSHLPTTTNRVSPFQKWVQDKLGMKGVIHTPPYSAWFNPIELFFSYVKRFVRKFAPPDIPSLLQRIREATAKIDGHMIRGWFKKSGFIVGPEAPLAPDPNHGVVDRCTLPKNARFSRKEHILCVDESGHIHREKKPRYTRWTSYSPDDDIDGSLVNMSVVKRSGVRRKPTRITHCAEPEDQKKRWVGLSREPDGLQHGSYAKLFQNDDDMAEIEKIVDERKTSEGVQYKIKWKGHNDSYNEWIDADDIQGLGELLRYWRERNRRVEREKEEYDHKEEAKRPRVVVPYNRTPVVGKTVAILPRQQSSRPFYLGKVTHVTTHTVRIHWYHNTRVDGTYTLEYGKKSGKGLGPAAIGSVYRTRIIDTVASVTGTRGRIQSGELNRILALVKQMRKS